MLPAPVQPLHPTRHTLQLLKTQPTFWGQITKPHTPQSVTPGGVGSVQAAPGIFGVLLRCEQSHGSEKSPGESRPPLSLPSFLCKDSACIHAACSTPSNKYLQVYSLTEPQRVPLTRGGTSSGRLQQHPAGAVRLCRRTRCGALFPPGSPGSARLGQSQSNSSRTRSTASTGGTGHKPLQGTNPTRCQHCVRWGRNRVTAARSGQGQG